MDATGGAKGAGLGRMLVVLDGSADAEAAAGFAEAAARGFGTIASFVDLREQTARRRCERIRGGIHNGRHATTSTVSGPTQGSRNWLVAQRIAAEAKECGADVIVLGVDHRRLAHHRLSSSLRSQLAGATDLPVLMAPPAPSEATVEPGARRTGARPGDERHGAEVGGLTRV